MSSIDYNEAMNQCSEGLLGNLNYADECEKDVKTARTFEEQQQAKEERDWAKGNARHWNKRWNHWADKEGIQ